MSVMRELRASIFVQAAWSHRSVGTVVERALLAESLSFEIKIF